MTHHRRDTLVPKLLRCDATPLGVAHVTRNTVPRALQTAPSPWREYELTAPSILGLALAELGAAFGDFDLVEAEDGAKLLKGYVDGGKVYLDLAQVRELVKSLAIIGEYMGAPTTASKGAP